MSFELPFKLPTGWQVATVDELVKQKIIAKPLDGNHGGIHPKASDYIESGVPFVMASDLAGGRVDLIDCKFISEEQASGLRKGIAKAGDVLLSHKATIGRTAIVQDSKHDFIMLTPQVTYYRVINSSALSNIYLKAYFDSRFFQSILGLWAGAGSTRAYLGITGQLKLPIILPPIEIQNEISGQVHALNKKVNLNNEINQTLEEMAQAIFKSWFVDFDPVKAKMNGKQPEGMDAATASLFPEKLVESELGLIPEGWKVKKIGDVAERYSVGKKYSQKTAVESGLVPILDQGKSGIIGYHNDKPGVKASLDNPIIVFANHTCYMKLVTYDFSAIQNVLPFKLNGCDIYWSYLATQGKQKFVEYKGHWPDFMIHEIVIPSEELMQRFGELVKPFYSQMASNENQNKSLAKLRDTLLPKLLSGEIELDVEKVNTND
ncbi:restriction endonuclease subunit S [Vibrio alginolyticus]|uniref:restriction endonuclease subunit S n=1 Tax=Vibrio alginolyticus TaxID=663 RepID=UPI001EEA9839|nr:restriction endonuclease subunit S [Vibrio alginolyticus]MCG6308946.1 restriction endonuclease subunit S [Vibrio alginolyticus]